MRKYYKTKSKNITKLKAYLENGSKTNGKRGGRRSSGKHDSSKCNNL